MLNWTSELLHPFSCKFHGSLISWIIWTQISHNSNLVSWYSIRSDILKAMCNLLIKSFMPAMIFYLIRYEMFYGLSSCQLLNKISPKSQLDSIYHGRLSLPPKGLGFTMIQLLTKLLKFQSSAFIFSETISSPVGYTKSV